MEPETHVTNEGGGNAVALKTDKLPITLALAGAVKDVKDERSGKDLGAGKAFTLDWKLNEAAVLSFAGDPPKYAPERIWISAGRAKNRDNSRARKLTLQDMAYQGPIPKSERPAQSLFCSRSCRDNGTIPTDNREQERRLRRSASPRLNCAVDTK